MQQGLAGMPMAIPVQMGMLPHMMQGMVPVSMVPMSMSVMPMTAMTPIMQAPMHSPWLASMSTTASLLGTVPTVGTSQASGASGGGAVRHDSDSDLDEKDEEYDAVDADVRKLADHFKIEERWVARLSQLMRKRKATKSQDLLKLWDILDKARSPTGLLVAKIGEIESGSFDSKMKPDKHVERIVRKYDLDRDAKRCLIELGVRRRRTKQEDLDGLEKYLRHSRRPSSTSRDLCAKLLEGFIDAIPDLSEAEELIRRFRLDGEAKAKLCEIVVHRTHDLEDALQHVERILEMSKSTASETLCKIARTLIEGGQATNLERRLLSQQDSERSGDVRGDGRGRSRSRGRKR